MKISGIGFIVAKSGKVKGSKVYVLEKASLGTFIECLLKYLIKYR